MLLLNTTFVSSLPLVALVFLAFTWTVDGAIPAYVGTSTTICVCFTGKVYPEVPAFIWFCILVSIVSVSEASFLLYTSTLCDNSILWFAVHPIFTYISFEIYVLFPEESTNVAVNLIIQVWFVVGLFSKSGDILNPYLSPFESCISLKTTVFVDAFDDLI